MQLLYQLVKNFSKPRDCNLIDSGANLIVFKNWLERKWKAYFNPLPGIIATQDAPSKYQTQKINKLKINDILSANKDDNINLVTNDKEDSKSIKFWLFMKSCQLMDWINFKGKAIDERKDYIKLERLCYNCFSERHNLKDCWSKYCHVDYCNKRHHSFIHTDKESNQVATEEIRNDSITCNNIYDRNKQNSFTDLQVSLINVSNHNKTFPANPLLGLNPDFTLISKIAKKLNLCCTEGSLTITNVMSTKLKL